MQTEYKKSTENEGGGVVKTTYKLESSQVVIRKNVIDEKTTVAVSYDLTVNTSVDSFDITGTAFWREEERKVYFFLDASQEKYRWGYDPVMKIGLARNLLKAVDNERWEEATLLVKTALIDALTDKAKEFNGKIKEIAI